MDTAMQQAMRVQGVPHFCSNQLTWPAPLCNVKGYTGFCDAIMSSHVVTVALPVSYMPPQT